jgi:methionyl-tRNA formyltransferase
MGTPSFSLPFVEAVLEKHDVLAVVTQPDKPRGRGLKLKPSPVKKFAEKRGIRVLTPQTLDLGFKLLLQELNPETIVVAAYGKILPPWLLKLPPKGCLNVHPSLLPKFRGAAPIQRAILEGEKETGVSIMKLVEEMDAGGVYASARVSIEEDDDYASLEKKLSEVGSKLLLQVLREIEEGRAEAVPQDPSQATFALKIKKEETYIDWRQEAQKIRNLIRALSPKPGARAFFKRKEIKILKATLEDVQEKPGEVVLAHPKHGLIVSAGKGGLKIEKLKPEGKRDMSGEEFVRGYHIKEGDFFQSQKSKYE